MATSCDYVGTVLVEKILDPFTSNCGRNVEKIRYRGNAVIDKLSAVVRRGSGINCCSFISVSTDFKTHGLPGPFHIIMTVSNEKFDYILKKNRRV